MRLRQAGRGWERRCARLPLVVMALAVLAGRPAVADDRDSGAVAPWSGFHFGGQVGAGRSTHDWEYKNPNVFNTLGAQFLFTEFNLNDRNVVGGIFGGYDYQSGPMVYGVELSGVYDGFDDREGSSHFATDHTTSKLGWHAATTARVGYATDRWLLYGKGGVAAGRAELSIESTQGPTYARENFWAFGWTAGVGVDYRVRDDVSVGIGYDYTDLRTDERAVECPACGVGVGFGTPLVEGRFKVQTLMLRVSYRFGDEYRPP